MSGYYSSEDQRPLAYWHGKPIYVTTLLVILHVATFLACALLTGAGHPEVLLFLQFMSGAVLQHAALWQFVTYAFVHAPEQGIWFAIEMLLLFHFGRETEQFLGRTSFLRLYIGLLLLVPVVLTLVGLVFPNRHAGSGALHFAVFVAFATLYPNVAIFFGLTAKWIAAILIGVYTVQAFAFKDWALLVSLWASSGAAALYICHARGNFTLPSLQLFQRRPRLSVVRPEPRRGERPARGADAVESIDRLLDKIAKSGMASLTPKERDALERAREALMRKDSETR